MLVQRTLAVDNEVGKSEVQGTLAVDNDVNNDESGQQVRLMTTSPANAFWLSMKRSTKQSPESGL